MTVRLCFTHETASFVRYGVAMDRPPANIAGAIADARADQAWATLNELIDSEVIDMTQLSEIAVAIDSGPDAFRELSDDDLDAVRLLCYAALHYASARLMERLDESE